MRSAPSGGTGENGRGAEGSLPGRGFLAFAGTCASVTYLAAALPTLCRPRFTGVFVRNGAGPGAGRVRSRRFYSTGPGSFCRSRDLALAVDAPDERSRRVWLVRLFAGFPAPAPVARGEPGGGRMRVDASGVIDTIPPLTF